MTMPSTFFLAPMDLEDLPCGVRYPHMAVPEVVVSRYVRRYSREGDLVFDPFAGYGSTLRVAHRLGRRAFGVEIDPERLEYASRELEEEIQLIAGDMREIAPSRLPEVDFCFTGPPFFGSDRLMNVDIPCLCSNYDDYLADLAFIFGTVAQQLKPGGHVVALFCNLKVGPDFLRPGSPAGLFPLAWDAGKCINEVIPLIAEEVWCISQGGGHSPFVGQHGQFLVFHKPDGGGDRSRSM